MRPRGPLPPRVYWTRRLLLVAVVVVVGAVLWWVMPGVGGSGNASADPGNGGTPSGDRPPTTASSHPTSSPSTAGHATAHHPATTHHPAPGHLSQATPGHATPSHRHRPAPSGPCDPAKVTLAVAVDSAPEGHGTTVGLRMSTPDGSTCSLGITPSLLETRITSGDVIVWQSRSCPDGLPAKNVVVRPRPAVVYSFDWDGQINPDSCSSSNRVAQPGGYWAEAALIGGEPHKTYFDVTAPSTPVRQAAHPR